jgi:hypothetical protein
MSNSPVENTVPSGPDRLSRIRDLVTECNFLFNLVRDEGQLINGICRLIVGTGDFSTAWIRLFTVPVDIQPVKNVLQNETSQVRKDYYFSSSHPARCTAMPASLSQSCINLPLNHETSTFGILTLDSSDLDPLDEHETRLFTQLAANLAACLLSLRGGQQASHQQPREITHPARPAWPGQRPISQMRRYPLLDLLIDRPNLSE